MRNSLFSLQGFMGGMNIQDEKHIEQGLVGKHGVLRDAIFLSPLVIISFVVTCTVVGPESRALTLASVFW
jgi:hypothetical protein